MIDEKRLLSLLRKQSPSELMGNLLDIGRMCAFLECNEPMKALRIVTRRYDSFKLASDKKHVVPVSKGTFKVLINDEFDLLLYETVAEKGAEGLCKICETLQQYITQRMQPESTDKNARAQSKDTQEDWN